MNNSVACVILNYNDADTTITLIEKIRDYSAIDNIVIIDNNSTDDSTSRLAMFENDKIKLVPQTSNRGYGAGNNAGVRFAYDGLGCKNVIICNPDVEFTEKCVASLKDVLQSNEKIAVAASLQYHLDGSLEKEYAWRIPTIKQWILSPEHMIHDKYWPYYKMGELEKWRKDKKKYADVDCVPGAMLMVDAEKFIECGGYDESNFLYCEETILAIKLKNKGYRTVLVPDEKYTHYESATVKKNIKSRVKRKSMMMKSRCSFLKNWLGASGLQCKLGRLIADIAILETGIDCIFRK